MSNVFPSVTGYQDAAENKVKAAYMNIPVNQLRARTDYLKRKLDDIVGAGLFESVRLQNVRLSATNTPMVSDVVAYDTDTASFVKAVAEGMSFPVTRYAYGVPEAYALGVLVRVDGLSGTVVAYGNCSVDLAGMPVATLLEDGEPFRSGPYYLSPRFPGRLTARPSGMAVYVGVFESDSSDTTKLRKAYVSPTVKDLWESHVHMAFVLGGIPAGSVEVEDVAGIQTARVNGFIPKEFIAGGLFGGVDVPVRMKIVGSWTRDTEASYDFGVVSVDGTMSGCNFSWTSSDGLDEGTVKVNNFEHPYPLGESGMYVILEKAFSYTSPDGNFSKLGRTVQLVAGLLDTSAANIGDPVYYDPSGPSWSLSSGVGFEQIGLVVTKDASTPYVEIGGFAGVAYSWTLDMPDEATGWLQKTVRNMGAYSAPGTNPGYSVFLFGRYNNAASRSYDELSFEVTAGNSFSYGAGNVTLLIKDLDGNTVNTLTSVSFDKPYSVKGSSDEYDLLFVITQRNPDGTEVVATSATVGDKWTFQVSDPFIGAKFEYSMGMDRRANPYYPPVPITSVVLEMNGVTMDIFEEFSPGNGTYGFTPDTLYWMVDEDGTCPFPQDWESMAATLPMNLKFYHNSIRMAETGIVNTLRTEPGSGLEIVDYRTGAGARFGDLVIRNNFRNSISDVGLAGHTAIKGVRSDGVFLSGPVVERIFPGAGISITKAQGSTAAVGQGSVVISATTSELTWGDFTDVTLENAKQELVPGRMTSFIKLLRWNSQGTANIPSGFIAKFRIPYNLTGKYRVVVYFTVFGLEGFADGVNVENKKYAGLTFSYSILQDFSTVASGGYPARVFRNLLETGSGGVLEVSTPVPGDIVFGNNEDPNKGYMAYDPFLMHNDVNMTVLEGQILPPFQAKAGVPAGAFPFDDGQDDPSAVTAGSIVAVRVSRSSVVAPGHVGNNEYTGEIGFVDMKWKLVSVL